MTCSSDDWYLAWVEVEDKIIARISELQAQKKTNEVKGEIAGLRWSLKLLKVS